MKKERGHYAVFEGGSAVGKTTQIKRLRNEQGGPLADWVFVREPGGTKFGERVREAVQGLNGYEVHPLAELFAYSAVRANLIQEVVIPSLERGENVMSDRSWFSTWAYQGAGGVPKVYIWLASMIATRGAKPDVVLYYDLPVEMGQRRMMEKKDLDRLDLKKLEFHEQVRRNYLQLGWLYPRIWRTIDASQGVEQVYADSVKALREAGLVE